MNFVVKTSLGILLIIILVYADVDQSNDKFQKQCQILQCNQTTEICHVKLECKQDDLSKCVYCILKNNLTFVQQLPPLASRLLSKTNESNTTSDDTSYDEYYEYDEDETSDKNEYSEEIEYLDDYVDSLDLATDRTQPMQKLDSCPKIVQAIGKCDTEKMIPSECQFDTECPGDLKCCEAACGRRVCNIPITTTGSVCPASFECSLNCRLGYQTDLNGCLKCECQSCPSMSQCNKNCPTSYLKDLFGCDICECNDQCPPFTCSILCPPGVGFAKSENGCPLCQCAISKSKPIEYTSSCQEDVHCPPGFRCLNDARNVPMCQTEPILIAECPNDFSSTCDLQCPDGNYLVDGKGCPTCACAANEARPVVSCPQIKCRANCGDAGYQLNENGCQTCKCVSKESVQCSRVMCRMYCQHGFKRDENGCEYCACNESPQQCPQLNCERTCTNGYRKDYSGCQTCECACVPTACPASLNNCTKGLKKDADGCPICSCDEQQGGSDDKCLPINCDLQCKNGLQRDEWGCQSCSCNRCPLRTCRMFCMYGFRRNDDGCEVCECDWTPVAEKIQCSERIPCEDTRVCNLNLRLCEAVDPDKVNWFLYDFEIESDMFNDPKFLQTFKSGFIHNVAAKYGLEITQIVVSSVKENGLTSFHIMPFFAENMAQFEAKMDQIDIDLNSYEFRAVLPAVARAIEKGEPVYPSKTSLHKICDKLKDFARKSPKSMISLVVLVFAFAAFIIGLIYINSCRYRMKNRSDSKLPIYDTSYHPAPTEEDHYHAVHAPDGTAYVVVESDDIHSSNDKRALV